MIEYVIKSAVCLAILLAFYHFLFQREKMHQFNRYYLLISLGFGMIIPLINLGFSKNPLEMSGLRQMPQILENAYSFPTNILAGVENSKAIPTEQYSLLVFSIYIFISSLLLIRFLQNLLQIAIRIIQNKRIKVDQGTIVLLEETIVPHSFLGYTFLTKNEYLSGQTKAEIIKHEFTHVSQLHSLDILFIELLKVVFWFNPVFMFYKRAIQLNHEFLADEAVIAGTLDTTAYQHLLLQTGAIRTVKLASNFNYSITKKRLKMMTKRTSKRRKMVMGLSLIPTAAILMLGFSDQVFAQGTTATTELKINIAPQNSISKDEYYKGSTIRFTDDNGVDTKNPQKYDDMSETEKKKLPSPTSPNNHLFSLWKDSLKYKVIVNFDAPLKDLDILKPADFVSYESYESPKDKITYIFLLTKDFLEEMKKLGASFNWVNNGATVLSPPPPVVEPAKN